MRHGPARHIEHGEEHRGHAAAGISQGEKVRELEAAYHREVLGRGVRGGHRLCLFICMAAGAGRIRKLLEPPRGRLLLIISQRSRRCPISVRTQGKRQSRSAAEGSRKRP